MSLTIATKARLQLWQITVCSTICAYLTLSALTHTLRTYHWFMLLLIPGTFLLANYARRFFIDWLPLLIFWLLYDRLRLIQPKLLSRVAVEIPYHLEQYIFGWLFSGQIPSHAARACLQANAGLPLAQIISFGAQLVYFSHIFILPLLMFIWWIEGTWLGRSREKFISHLKAFTLLNAMGIVCYLLLPAAPPWWISLYGKVQPTLAMLTHTTTKAAMEGAIVQGLIAHAPLWFAAFPSLHAAYPVLLFLLARQRANPLAMSATAIYAIAMWVATVVLNQHYIVDLIAGAVFAYLAYQLSLKLKLPSLIKFLPSSYQHHSINRRVKPEPLPPSATL